MKRLKIRIQKAGMFCSLKKRNPFALSVVCAGKKIATNAQDFSGPIRFHRFFFLANMFMINVFYNEGF